MTSGIATVVFPVKDLEQAKSVFGRLLGVAPIMEEPYYVQFNAGGQEIGLDPHGHGKGMTGPVCHWQVDDIETSVKQLATQAPRCSRRPVM